MTLSARRGVLLTVVCCLALVAPLLPVAAQDEIVVRRVSGDNRYSTASALARDTFPQGADQVFVATGQSFPDALAAVPPAARERGPILLVTRTTVPGATERALRDLDPDSIVLFGGTEAVSAQVATELRRQAPVTRVAGETRYETAARTSARFSETADVVHVASGASFPDALAAGPAAAAADGPVLLVRPTAVPPETATELERLSPSQIVVVGGTEAVSAAVEDELADYADEVMRREGANRYDTAVQTSRSAFAPQGQRVYLATGADYPDALAGGVAAGVAGGPVLLTPRHCVPDLVRAEVDRLDSDEVVLLGGTQALSEHVRRLGSCDRDVEVIARNLQVPWSVAFAADGSAFVSERDRGRILRRTQDGQVSTVNEISVNAAGEGGLLGLTFDPDGEYLYAYLTTNQDNRVVRMLPGEDPSPILTGIPRASNHNGGALSFGPDGMLYVATGDAAQPQLAQNRDSLAGKILRVTATGDVPDDNPDADSPVWALGFRNVQGLAWDAEDRLYATEFGPDRDDEINLVVADGNYGWPEVTGPSGDERFIDPIAIRQPPVASWSGAVILHDSAIPEWDGSLFAAALRGQRLWRFTLTDGEVAGAEQLLHGEFGRLRDVAQAPDGSLWVLTSNRDGRGSPTDSDDRIIRIGPPRD